MLKDAGAAWVIMNVLRLGGKVIGSGLALELVETFLQAHFSEAPRHQRRLGEGTSN